jgi:hypothetical protein
MAAPWIALMVTLWVMVAALSILALGLIRRVERLEIAISRGHAAGRSTIHGPTIGLRPPAVEGFERLASPIAPQQPRLVLFLSSTCGACGQLTEELLAYKSDPGESPALSNVALNVVVDEDLAMTLADGPWSLLSQNEGELSKGWSVPGTPYVVALDRAGSVQSSEFLTTLTQLSATAESLTNFRATTELLVGTA